jgi:hypothetical protein
MPVPVDPYRRAVRAIPGSKASGLPSNAETEAVESGPEEKQARRNPSSSSSSHTSPSGYASPSGYVSPNGHTSPSSSTATCRVRQRV